MRRMWHSRHSVLLALMCTAYSLPLLAQVSLYSVPSDRGIVQYLTLQDRVDQAMVGDTIWIDAGDYDGPVFISKSLTLYATPGSDVHIHGTIDSLPAISIEGEFIQLVDLKITGKTIDQETTFGNHGIQISHSKHILITDCMIHGGLVHMSEYHEALVGKAGYGLIITHSNHVIIVNCGIVGGDNEYSSYYYAGPGGHGMRIDSGREIQVDSCVITGGNGGSADQIAGSGGYGLIVDHLSRLKIRDSDITGGKSGNIFSGNPYYSSISGVPAVKISNCDSIEFLGSSFYGSSGIGDGHGIHAYNVDPLFLIKSCTLKGAGDNGHGLYANASTAHILKSGLYGGNGTGRYPTPGNGIHAVSYSVITVDETSVIKGGGTSWTADSIYRDGSSTVTVETEPDTTKEESVKCILLQNYPNPFTTETTISYVLPDQQSRYHVHMQLFDVQGRKVLTLKYETEEGGSHSLKWNGCDSGDVLVPSGIYFCILKAGISRSDCKLLLVR